MKIKEFNTFINESVDDDSKARKSFDDMVFDFSTHIWSFVGLGAKLAIKKYEEKDPEKLKKIDEVLQFLKRIEPGFKEGKDFISARYQYKRLYSNVEKYVSDIYKTLNYLIPTIKYLDIKGCENIAEKYKEYVKNATLTPDWFKRLPAYLLK